jgi:hypothetical protein
MQLKIYKFLLDLIPPSLILYYCLLIILMLFLSILDYEYDSCLMTYQLSNIKPCILRFIHVLSFVGNLKANNTFLSMFNVFSHFLNLISSFEFKFLPQSLSLSPSFSILFNFSCLYTRIMCAFSCIFE